MKKRLTYFLFPAVLAVTMCLSVKMVWSQRISDDQAPSFAPANTEDITKKEKERADWEQNTRKQFQRKPHSNKPIHRFLETTLIDSMTLMKRTHEKKRLVSDSRITYGADNWRDAKNRYSEALIPQRFTKWGKSEDPISIRVPVASQDNREYIEAAPKVKEQLQQIIPELEQIIKRKIKIVEDRAADIIINLPTGWSSGNARDRFLAGTSSKDCESCYFVNESARVFAEPLKKPSRNRLFSTSYIVYMIYNPDYTIQGSHCLLTKSGFQELNQFVKDCLVTTLGLTNINKHESLNWEEYIYNLNLLYSHDLKPGMSKLDFLKNLKNELGEEFNKIWVQENYDYIHTDKKSQATSAVLLKDGVMVYGAKRYLKFDDNFRSAHFSGPHKLGGHIQHIRQLDDKSFVAAGISQTARGVTGFKTRNQKQALLILTKPYKLSRQIKKVSAIPDQNEVFALEVNKGGNPVLLSGNARSYRISIWDKAIEKPIKTAKFGIGKNNGSFSIVENGNYFVVGFEYADPNHVVPYYWEFSPDLKLLNKGQLGTDKKKMFGHQGLVDTVSYKGDVYAMYGWKKSGLGSKAKLPNELTVSKLTGEWDKKAEFPFHYSAKLFITPEGRPYAVFPRLNEVHHHSFDPQTGVQIKRIYPRPSEPIECFPPHLSYKLIDVLDDGEDNSYAIFSGSPLEHHEAGCVTIARIKHE